MNIDKIALMAHTQRFTLIKDQIKKYTIKVLYKLGCMPDQLLHFLQLQLFITLFSWPILLYWGIPLSLASPIGNFIFTPFITIFLFLSSIIFFTELFFIPNSFFIWLLEKTSDFWIYVISCAKKSWLLGFAQPHTIIALSIPLLAYLVINCKSINSLNKRTIALIILTFFIFIFLKLNKPKQITEKIKYLDKTIELIHRNNRTCLIDSTGAIAKISASSWVNYNLISMLTKKGITSLDHVIILKSRPTSFKAITALCDAFEVKNIYLNSWHQRLNNRGWCSWQKLLEIVKKNEINLHIINVPLGTFTQNLVKIETTSPNKIT